ncbi:DUF721 domain-containing protein [Bartonella sp. DGB2]|uniref:DUF721 domain-containing protein n=1 Tax=Bartonella sp. DGB2 TaxID=3388426 RepID=UPI00398F97AB
MNMDLLSYWSQLVGQEVAAQSVPIKIRWPKQAGDNKRLKPGTLVIVCEGFAMVKLQHETKQLIERVNGFFGYEAINKIKIEQKYVTAASTKPLPEKPVIKDYPDIAKMVEPIEDEKMRELLYTLGCAIRTESESNKK